MTVSYCLLSVKELLLYLYIYSMIVNVVYVVFSVKIQFLLDND